MCHYKFNLVPSPRRFVQRSLSTLGDPRCEEVRRAELEYIPEGIQRDMATKIHDTTLRYPRIASCIFQASVPPTHLQKIGQGACSNVYRVDRDTVIKVDQPSLYMTKTEQKEHASLLRYEHEAMCSAFGSMVVPHEISIGNNPFVKGQRGITITQPHIDLDAIDLVTNPEHNRLHTRLSRFEARNPGASDQFSLMTDTGRVLHRDSELCNDVYGNNNVGIDRTDGQLKIIDGQPLAPRHDQNYTLMPELYDRLDQELALVEPTL